MNISQIYESIISGGSDTGIPALFVRLSGCNIGCTWCSVRYSWCSTDPDYSVAELTVKELIERINNSKLKYVVWTGGEPALQIQDIYRCVAKTTGKVHTIETNGTIKVNPVYFHKVIVSPKSEDNWEISLEQNVEINVVTDLVRIGMDILQFATVVTPLTIFDEKKDLLIKRRVWRWCVDNNVRYGPRINVDLYGNERGR